MPYDKRLTRTFRTLQRTGRRGSVWRKFTRLALAAERRSSVLHGRHTTRCVAWSYYLLAAQAEFRRWRPNACSGCGGESGRYFGGSLYEPPYFVECPFCLDEEKCPGCSGSFPLDEGGDWPTECAFCGWRMDYPDVLPPGPDCLGECRLTAHTRALMDDPVGYDGEPFDDLYGV